MDKAFAIFDMDGTLVDSMDYWRGLAREYLARRDLPPPRAAGADQAYDHDPVGGAVHPHLWTVRGTPQTLAGEMNAMIEAHYRGDIP